MENFKPKTNSALERLNNQPLSPELDQTNIRNLTGFFEVVSTIPTQIPKKFWDSIKIYVNGGTTRLYIYAGTSGWLYTTLT